MIHEICLNWFKAFYSKKKNLIQKILQSNLYELNL